MCSKTLALCLSTNEAQLMVLVGDEAGDLGAARKGYVRIGFHTLRGKSEGLE